MARAKKQEKVVKMSDVSVPVITGRTAKGRAQKVDINVPIPAYIELMVHVRGTEGGELLTNKLNDDILSDNPAEAKLKKQHRLPAEVYERSKYLDAEGNDCIPGDNWRRCFADAAVTMDGVSKASLHREMVILDEMPRLDYKDVYMRRDMGRDSGVNRAPRLIFRAAYRGWECKIPVRIMLNETTFERAVALFKMAGLCIGIGDWRPGAPKGGSKGTFDVVSVEVIGGTVTIKELQAEPKAA